MVLPKRTWLYSPEHPEGRLFSTLVADEIEAMVNTGGWSYSPADLEGALPATKEPPKQEQTPTEPPKQEVPAGDDGKGKDQDAGDVTDEEARKLEAARLLSNPDAFDSTLEWMNAAKQVVGKGAPRSKAGLIDALKQIVEG